MHRARSLAARLLALAVCAALAACGSTRDAERAPEAPLRELPATWRDCEPLAFEELVDARFPAGTGGHLGTGDLADLRAALAEPPLVAVRAAVLLGRSLEPAAAEVLVQRLEECHAGPERADDAGDVVAASALVAFGPDAERARRLEQLAVGVPPHPDLEVRVEVARAALALGRDGAAPFLLSVLRIGTPVGRTEGTFWPAPANTAWARERAAEVLAWRAGVENHYAADASLADRDREADRLHDLLVAVGAVSEPLAR